MSFVTFIAICLFVTIPAMLANLGVAYLFLSLMPTETRVSGRLFLYRLFHSYTQWTMAVSGSMVTILIDNFMPSKLIIHGDIQAIIDAQKSIITANHQIYTDCKNPSVNHLVLLKLIVY